MGNFNTHTQTLNGGTITISASDNVLRISVLTTSGTVTATGSTTFQGTPSNNISFSTGQGFTIVSPSTNVPIDGLTINASAGVADLLISTQ